MVFLFMWHIDKNDTCISSKNCKIIWHSALKNHGDKTNHVLSLSIDFTSREIQTEWNSWCQIKWSKALFEHILNKLSNYLLQGDVNTFTGSYGVINTFTA